MGGRIGEAKSVSRARAERDVSTVIDSYTDPGIWGGSLLRSGVQELLADGLKPRFYVILTESLDRLSRDQEDWPAAGFLDTVIRTDPNPSNWTSFG